MHLTRNVIGALAALLFTGPVYGAQLEITGDRSPRSASAFQVRALSDAELGFVVGTGLGNPSYARDLTQDDWQSVSRNSGGVLQATFDNWFADVGTSMIMANIINERAISQ